MGWLLPHGSPAVAAACSHHPPLRPPRPPRQACGPTSPPASPGSHSGWSTPGPCACRWAGARAGGAGALGLVGLGWAGLGLALQVGCSGRPRCSAPLGGPVTGCRAAAGVCAGTLTRWPLRPATAGRGRWAGRRQLLDDGSGAAHQPEPVWRAHRPVSGGPAALPPGHLLLMAVVCRRPGCLLGL